ncbi:MAG: SPOR domain-containing protein [Gammaproteobacteria bacterium]|nr:SPOR domain-containing protein [Gammaproteobacteria bacterium]
MEKTLQQRLVGAVVLVALGVILVPALLDGSGYKSRHDRNIEIPARPVLPTLEEVQVKPVEIPTPVDIRKERVEQKKKDIPPKPIQSWTLQVGTFSQESNALSFRDSLRKEGYTAYSESSETGGNKNYRVYIGPELEKHQLEKIQAKLKAEKKINALILSHP